MKEENQNSEPNMEPMKKGILEKNMDRRHLLCSEGQTAHVAADVTVITIQNQDRGTNPFEINYQGSGWQHAKDSWNNKTGEYFEFEFIGNRFRLVGAKDPVHGIAGISIDGGPEQKADLYAPIRQPAALYFESPELKAGKHQVKVTVTGEKNLMAGQTHVAIDKIVVDVPADMSLIQLAQADVQHAGFIQQGTHTPVMLRLNQVFSDFVPKSMNIHFDKSILKIIDVTGLHEGLQAQMTEVSSNKVAVNFTTGNPLKQQKTANLASMNVKAEGNVGETGSITITDLIIADSQSRETVISELKADIPITRRSVMSFSVISDIQGDYKDFDTALKQLSIINPNSKAMVINGDITNGGGVEEYDLVRNVIYKNAVPFNIISSVGNHEFYEAKWNNYKTSEEEMFRRFYEFAGVDKPYYSRVVAGIPFIVLGTEKYMGFHRDFHIDQVYMSDEQLNFLRSELEKYSKGNKPVFVFCHHVLKDTCSGSLIDAFSEAYIQNDEIRSILGDYSNAIFFSSHSHWSLDLPDWAVNVKVPGGDEKGFTAINTGAIAHGMMLAGPDGGSKESPEGIHFNQGLRVDVFEDEVVIKGRNFRTSSWLQEYIVKIDKASTTM